MLKRAVTVSTLQILVAYPGEISMSVVGQKSKSPQVMEIQCTLRIADRINEDLVFVSAPSLD